MFLFLRPVNQYVRSGRTEEQELSRDDDDDDDIDDDDDVDDVPCAGKARNMCAP